MAHKDGSGYYTKVVLIENGEATPRRIQRMEWQGKDGLVHCLEGKYLPADLLLHTGLGVKEKHFARFLGVKTATEPSWLTLLPTKPRLAYAIMGAALVLVLKATLTLAATAF
jgi:hypothetical protein